MHAVRIVVASALIILVGCGTAPLHDDPSRVPISGPARGALAQPQYDARYASLEERDAGAARMAAGFEHVLSRRGAARIDAPSPSHRPEGDCALDAEECRRLVDPIEGIAIDDAGNLVIEEPGR